MKELPDSNGTLKKELEDPKSMHNNYLLRVQTLINQKAIEAPGAKKTMVVILVTPATIIYRIK